MTCGIGMAALAAVSVFVVLAAKIAPSSFGGDCGACEIWRKESMEIAIPRDRASCTRTKENNN